jgi:hypothetical protein
LPAAAERPVQLGQGPQLIAAGLGQLQFEHEQLLVGDQNIEVRRQPVVISGARQLRGVAKCFDAPLLLGPF